MFGGWKSGFVLGGARRRDFVPNMTITADYCCRTGGMTWCYTGGTAWTDRYLSWWAWRNVWHRRSQSHLASCTREQRVPKISVRKSRRHNSRKSRNISVASYLLKANDFRVYEHDVQEDSTFELRALHGVGNAFGDEDRVHLQDVLCTNAAEIVWNIDRLEPNIRLSTHLLLKTTEWSRRKIMPILLCIQM